MRRLALLICGAALALVAIASGQSAQAQVDWRIDQVRVPRGWTEEYHEGPSPFDRQYLQELQIRSASNDELVILAESAHIDLALRAAWELARQVGGEKTTNRNRPFDRVRIESFVALLEKHLAVKPPEWWKDLLCNGSYSGRRSRSDHFGEHSKEFEASHPRDWYHRTWFPVGDSEYLCHKWYGVRRSGGDLVVPMEGRESTIRDGAAHLELLLRGHHGFCLEIVGDRAILAGTNWHGSSFPISCVDRRSGNLRWTREVWSSGLHAGGSGVYIHWDEMIAEGNRVAVFGWGPGVMSAEVFDVETGTCHVRFCTGYLIDSR